MLAANSEYLGLSNVWVRNIVLGGWLFLGFGCGAPGVHEPPEPATQTPVDTWASTDENPKVFVRNLETTGGTCSNGYKILQLELLQANSGLQNFKGQIELDKILGAHETIVSANTSYAYSMTDFNLEVRLRPTYHWVVSFNPGEELNHEDVGAALFFQSSCCYDYNPMEETDTIRYEVNSLSLDLARQVLAYDFNLENTTACYGRGCRYTPKVLAILALNVQYRVPEERVIYQNGLERGPQTYLFTGNGPDAQPGTQLELQHIRHDNTMIRATVPWGPHTSGSHVKLMLFANGHAPSYDGINLTGTSQIAFRARSTSGAKLYTHFGTADDTDHRSLGLIDLDMQWQDFAFDISDGMDLTDINSLISFVLDRSQNPYYSWEGLSHEFEIDDIRLLRRRLPVERKWASKDPEVNGDWNWSHTWREGSSYLANLNQWGDVEYLTYGTGGEFGWTNRTVAMDFRHTGNGSAGAMITTSRSPEGLNPFSAEDRDAGKDISFADELRFTAWTGEAENQNSLQDIVQLDIRLHDAHGNQSASTFLNNHRKECFPDTGISQDRRSFMPVSACQYRIPMHEFDNGTIDRTNIVSVEFYVDSSVHQFNNLVEVRDLRFHQSENLLD